MNSAQKVEEILKVIFEVDDFSVETLSKVRKDKIPAELYEVFQKAKEYDDFREKARKGQEKGIARAKAEGVKFGRPRIPNPDGFEDVIRQVLSGQLTAVQGTHKLGMSNSTFNSRLREHKAKEGNKGR